MLESLTIPIRPESGRGIGWYTHIINTQFKTFKTFKFHRQLTITLCAFDNRILSRNIKKFTLSLYLSVPRWRFHVVWRLHPGDFVVSWWHFSALLWAQHLGYMQVWWSSNAENILWRVNCKKFFVKTETDKRVCPEMVSLCDYVFQLTKEVLLMTVAHIRAPLHAYRALTFLYVHNQHAHVTSVKVFVNARCFKIEDRLFVQPVHLRSTRTIVTSSSHQHTYFL